MGDSQSFVYWGIQRQGEDRPFNTKSQDSIVRTIEEL